MSEQNNPTSPSSEEQRKLEQQAKFHRLFAAASNNAFWRLSEQQLSDGQKLEILETAFASLYHWRAVGTEENKHLAYLAVARALTLNNTAGLALSYAEKCHAFFANSEHTWIRAFTNAIMSHASLINNRPESAASFYAVAKELGDALPPEDKDVFDATFALIPQPAQAA